jgi:hypothetical protein
VRHDDPVHAGEVRRDGVPVVGHDRPEIQHRRLTPSFSALLGATSARCTTAPHGDDQHVVALATDAALPNGTMKFFAGILALVVGLPVEVLVLEEQHRIVAPDRRPQQSGGVLAFEGTRCGCPGSARRCSRPTGCDTAAAAQIAADRHAHTIGHDEVVADR